MKILQKIRKQFQRIKLNKYSLIAILTVMGMSLTCPISVYADGDSSSFEAACANISMPSNDVRYIISEGRKIGLTDAQLAGILSNFSAESGGCWWKLQGNRSWHDNATGAVKSAGERPTVGHSYTIVEKPTATSASYDIHNHHADNSGGGLAQWTPFSKMANKCDEIVSATSCGYVTIDCYTAGYGNAGSISDKQCWDLVKAGSFTHWVYKMPDLVGQVYYMYNYDGDKVKNSMAGCTTPETAAAGFFDGYEKGASSERAKHISPAQLAYAAVLAYDGKTYIPEDITGPGDDGDSPTPTGEDLDKVKVNDVDYELDQVYEELYEKGVITSDQLGAYYKLKEENMHLDDLRRDEFGAVINEDGELTAEEAEQYSENLRQLTQWEANVEGEKITLVKILRWICMFVGILMIMWVLAMYIAYWFDKVNTIIPFSVMAIVSFGHYVVSDNEDTSDVNMMNPEKTGKMKQINHKGLLIILLITLIFASFLISGVLFNWMRYGIIWVRDALGKLTMG